ncbi:hypothetical protein Tco_1224643, partial [Tanacetum coccineum]
MSASNQQTLVESGATDRPPITEKGNYIPWEIRFRRFLENKGEDGERMWYSITKGPYVRPMIADPDDPRKEILEPISKMTEANRKRYTADVRVGNYLLQAIPNDIYNSLDACIDAQKIWERIRRLMYGLEKNKHSIHSRLMNELTNLSNDVRPIKVSINTKFLKSLQPKWSKYVTLTPSKAKKAAKKHDPLALIAHSSQSQASPSYSYSPQPYYVTHPSSVVNSEEDYQRELQRDAQEDKLTTSMMFSS